MEDPPENTHVMLVLAYGVVVPAGLLYAMRSFTATMRSMNLLTFALPFAWFVLIAVGILLLARRFMVPTDIVLGAGGLGTFVGFWVFSNVVGWGLEMVAIGAFALLAVVLGGGVDTNGIGTTEPLWNRDTGLGVPCLSCSASPYRQYR